jgi:sugar (pentulose or hexulose) kinase
LEFGIIMILQDLVIGIDSSTTACKALVVDSSGNVVASGKALLPLLMPRSSWHEQPASSWWEAACAALREAVAQINPCRLAALCICAQRETFVVTDEEGKPLANALLWMDERCRGLLPEIDRRYSRERIHLETGKPLSANLTLGKLFWLLRERPDLFFRPIRILDVHAFLAHRLTGRFATSWGCADPMGLFDMRTNTWNIPLIHAIGLRVEPFPELLPVGAYIGGILPAAAHEAGLPEGLSLFAGLGDGQAAGLGVCAILPGQAYLNLGTSVVSGTLSRRYLVNTAFRTMTGGIPGSFVLETVQLAGTYTTSWFIDNFVAGNRADAAVGRSRDAELEQAAALIPPGAAGLVLVPYWNGAMNPYWDAGASGIMAGLRGIHRPAHIYRAILEGIGFEQRLHAEGVEKALGQPLDRFIAVGGGAQSPLWCQIIADITGRRVFRPDTTEATALGAAILAAAAVGLCPHIATAAQTMTRINQQPFQPDPKRQVFYERIYQDVYRNLFPALRGCLDKLDDLTESARRPDSM